MLLILSFMFFSSTKSENKRAEQALPRERRREVVGQGMGG
jgi:hypothetical protein